MLADDWDDRDDNNNNNNLFYDLYHKDSQISRTPSLATQSLEKVFHEKNTKEIQSRDYEVFCLHPRQTRQQLIENYFKVLPIILAL